MVLHVISGMILSANDNLELADFAPALARARRTMHHAEAAVAATSLAAQANPSGESLRRLNAARTALELASEALAYLGFAQMAAQELMLSR